jgi:hypothetical protein
MKVNQQSNQASSQRSLAFLFPRRPQNQHVRFSLAAAPENRPPTIRYEPRFFSDEPRTWSIPPRSNKRFAYILIIRDLRQPEFVTEKSSFKCVKHVQFCRKKQFILVVLPPEGIGSLVGAVVIPNLFRTCFWNYFRYCVGNCNRNCNRNSLASWFVLRSPATTRGLKLEHPRLTSPECVDVRSYAMISPDGRFFDSSIGRHQYSSRILEVGLASAFSEVVFDQGKYDGRDGNYDPFTGASQSLTLEPAA